MREAARGNGSLERRDRAPDRLHHRLFSHISTNWRGRPLVSHEVIVDLIGATTTRTGLTVHAELDRRSYPKGVKVADAALAAVPHLAQQQIGREPGRSRLSGRRPV